MADVKLEAMPAAEGNLKDVDTEKQKQSTADKSPESPTKSKGGGSPRPKSESKYLLTPSGPGTKGISPKKNPWHRTFALADEGRKGQSSGSEGSSSGKDTSSPSKGIRIPKDEVCVCVLFVPPVILLFLLLSHNFSSLKWIFPHIVNYYTTISPCL